jgi:glycosyltransferase involved in cell wall biosynthesis
MRLLVLSGAPLIKTDKSWKAYGPYVKEMEIWASHSDQIQFCCPIWETDRGLLTADISFQTEAPIPLKEFDVKSFSQGIKAAYAIVINIFIIAKAIRKADHIHLRCPGNIGLLGCMVQVFFPGKKKTAKYAGNWDWQSKQPKTYRLQQDILNNTFLTRNMQVLVYGKWPDCTKNILPFFTATYSQKDIVPSPVRELDAGQPIQLVFVGTLAVGKQPLLSVKVAEALVKAGYNVELNMFGEGSERAKLETYIAENELGSFVKLKGNQPAALVQEYYRNSHFLIFISKSEGWPKVVAESMFWGCVPITTKVSCVPEMVGNGERGTLVDDNTEAVVIALTQYLQNPTLYAASASKGMEWSRQFTMEKFETEIKKLL